MAKWLVTGAAGFLGSHVCENLLAQNETVLALDNLSWGRKEFLSPFESSSSFKFLEADIKNYEALKFIFNSEKPDHIVHLAALHFIPTAMKDPKLAVEINVLGTQILLQSMRDSDHRPKSFWFASTGDVYAPLETPLHEIETAKSPFNIYGLTKYMGEQMLELFSHEITETKFIVGRLFNLYGARETNPHILPAIIDQLKEQLKNNRPYCLSLGNTWPKRDMVPVSEAAKAVILMSKAAAKSEVPFAFYNVATGKAVSMDQMIETFGELLGQKIMVEKDPKKVRAVERAHLEANMARLDRYINFVPNSDLKTGLKALLVSEGLLKA